MAPILFHLGPIEIRLYGILFALALAQGIFLFKKFARAAGLPEKFVDSYLFWLALSIVLGARLGEVLFYEPNYYLAHPLEVFAVWHGGLASHGALIAGIITTWVFARKLMHVIPAKAGIQINTYLDPDFRRDDRKNYWLVTIGYWQHFLLLADLAAVPIALGAALVRIANFFNAEIVGLPTALPWGVVFQGYELPRHPVQLYEAGALLLTALIILLIKIKGMRGIFPKNKTAETLRAWCPAPSGTSKVEPLRPANTLGEPSLVVRGNTLNIPLPGTLFFTFLLLYLTSRFFLEFLKDFPHYAGLTTAQWLSIPFITLALFFLLQQKRRAL